MKPKILFFVTEDWYFCSHRLPIARAAKNSGYDVYVMTNVTNHGEIIQKEGFVVIPVSLNRRSTNLLGELSLFLRIVQIYKRIKPDIVHHVAMKPILYGSVAAQLTGIRNRINAFAGLGAIFITEGYRASLRRVIVSFWLRIALSGPSTVCVFQNADDAGLFSDLKFIPSGQISIIKGSGVNTKEFFYSPELSNKIYVTTVSRMLWDKGIGELVAAAEIIKQRSIKCTIRLIGDPDPANPASIPESQLKEWHNKGIVEWLGRRSDIKALYSQSHIAVLPSYREGLPKSLLEAASCGRPIIATDVPGCREICRNGENGLLVPVKDPLALANAIELLVNDPEMRKRMGKRGREIVVSEFSDSIVIQNTMQLYSNIIRERTQG